MTHNDISNLRLINQKIAGSECKTPKEVVSWMGAMQAQEYSMAKWAIGARLPGSTEKAIESAIDKGEIIRTHLLRPTWHFVASDDIYWLLDLTAPQIRSAMKSNDKRLELDETVFRKSNEILEKALEGGNHLTREELMNLLKSGGINTSVNRSSHLLMHAELDGILCSGITKNNKQTYASLPERVPEKTILNHDEALAKLARMYFRSHGPATLKDFTWWSGLPAGRARLALEMVKSEFVAETIISETYWFSAFNPEANQNKEKVSFLPAFDEFIISYKDRTSVLHSDNHKKAVSSNGIFRPVLVVNGKVEGIWRRTINKAKVVVETGFFQKPAIINHEVLQKAISAYEKYTAKEIQLAEMQITELR
jgi:hypothetical protein